MSHEHELPPAAVQSVDPDAPLHLAFRYDHRTSSVHMFEPSDPSNSADVSSQMTYMFIASVVGRAVNEAEERGLPKYEDIVFSRFPVSCDMLKSLGFDTDRGAHITIAVQWDESDK